MDPNPYASPVAAASATPPLTDAESTRNAYLSHEASVKSIGLLYFLGAFLMVTIGVVALAGAVASIGYNDAGPMEAGITLLIGVIYLGLGILQGATAIGLRKLKTWARWVAVVLSCIGLIGIPIGTIISGYFLYLLLSKKGAMVFSEEYKQVIAETPHIRYKTSIVVVILLVILAVLLGGAVMAAVFLG